MSFLTEKPLGIVYNFSREYNNIGAELQRRGLDVSFIESSSLSLHLNTSDLPFSLIYNDPSSPAGFPQTNGNLQSVLAYTKHLELNNYRLAQGRIINGSSALEVFASRSRQTSLLSSLRVNYPKTIIVNHPDKLISHLPRLKFPVLVKRDLIGQNEKVYRFDSISKLLNSILGQEIEIKNELIVVQEFHAPKNDHIIRVDTLNGKFLAAQKVFTHREPSLSWDIELLSEPFEPELEIISAVEDIVRAGRIDLGSVEYFTDRASNQVHFYSITPFHYRRINDKSEAVLQTIGDYFERRLHKIRQLELAI